MTRTIASPDADVLQQSQALGDPTRHAMFVHLRDAPEPVGVAALTEHFGLTHNAIRQHLAKLVAAGLVVGELDQPAGPGRPPRRYRATPSAAERWGGSSPFETLSMLLLELLRGGGTPREVGRLAGNQLAAGHDADAGTVEILAAVARRLGFEPHQRATVRGVDVVLDRCAFVGPATTAPGIVCDLHRGIAEGIAEHADDGAVIEDLVARPPRRAGCRIEVVAPNRASAS